MRHLAPVAPEICASDTVLEGVEKEARETRKGLWTDPQTVPPWGWRTIKQFGVSQYDPRNLVSPE